MNTARMRNISILVLLALVAAACTRSASTPPPGEGEGGEPADSQQATMEAVRSALLTQTAEAGGGGEVVPTEAPPEATAMPEGETEEEEGSTGGIVYVEYTVQEGDSITSIAEAFGVDPQAIVDLNGLGSPTEVTVGIVIKIPPSTGAVATPAPTSAAGGGGTVHVVQPGEWIWQIARNYGVDPNAIIAANDLANPSLIFPGMELIIP